MSVAAIALATFMTLPVQDTHLPFGMPPAEENPTMAKLAPDECMFYLRWASSKSLEDAGASSTEKLLSDPEFQQFLLSVVTQSSTILRESELGRLPQGEELIEKLYEVVPKLLANSGAIYVEQLNPAEKVIKAALAVDVGDSKIAVQELLDMAGNQWLAEVARAESWGDGIIYRVNLGGDAPEMALGMNQGLLVFSLGAEVADELLQRSASPAPDWVQQLESRLPMQRRALLGRVDLQRVIAVAQANFDPELQKLLGVSGIDRLRYLEVAAGFDGGEFTSKTRLTHEGELPPMLLPVSKTPLDKASFDPVPANAVLAFVANVDLREYVESWLAGMTEANPDDADEILAMFRGESEEGLPSLEKIVGALGESLAMYYIPDEGGFLGANFVFEVQDGEALREQEALIRKRFGEMFQTDDDEEEVFFRENDYRLARLEFEGETIYYIAANSFWNFSPVSMSWCLRDDQLIISLFPQNIKAILTRPTDTPTLATRDEVQRVLSQNQGIDGTPVEAMFYVDSPQILKSFGPYIQILLMAMREEVGSEFDFDTSSIPSGHLLAEYWTPDVLTVNISAGEVMIQSEQTMPGTDLALIGSGAALLGVVLDQYGFDAAQALSPALAEEEEARFQLMEIALAMHNYHDTFTRFPAAYSKDEDGKPLLSWRVHILPFLGEVELYDQFHLDEPWDSEHNIQLVAKIPHAYRAPGSEAEEGKTNYLTIRSENSIFPGGEGIRMADITDGSSNTLLVVEANDSVAVEWTRPDDLELDPMKPMKLLVGLRKEGFMVALADGSVTLFPESAGVEELMRWIGRNEGEVNQVDLWDR